MVKILSHGVKNAASYCLIKHRSLWEDYLVVCPLYAFHNVHSLWANLLIIMYIEWYHYTNTFASYCFFLSCRCSLMILYYILLLLLLLFLLLPVNMSLCLTCYIWFWPNLVTITSLWTRTCDMTSSGSKVTEGHRGQKGHIHQKSYFSFRLYGMVIWLMHIDQLNTFYKSFQLKSKFGIIWGHRGQKGNFHQKCKLVQAT